MAASASPRFQCGVKRSPSLKREGSAAALDGALATSSIKAEDFASF